MLELKKISKIYETENFKQKALDNVSICFRESEFVSILGPSGSGKTTFLNIIGGLDDYTSGDLIINGVSTKKYKDRDWDTYRNHKVGFVFQSYNLIPHQSILANVELALTLSGVSKKERKRRALQTLKKVGLEAHVSKRPNQLSGGQMQRVAIARALVNNPDIILADEPTGALDSKTSSQIMDLLKEVAKDRLVIMVTHNADLAHDYSTRIIELKDGTIQNDTNPYQGMEQTKNHGKTKKTSMSFRTALSLSLNNLMTKKGRTILTAFAGSIGIIGIALILSLSSGVQNYINQMQEEILTSYPLTIQDSTFDLASLMTAHKDQMLNQKEEHKEKDKIYSNNTIADTLALMSSKIQSNNLESFKKYIDENRSNLKDYTTEIAYEYPIDLQLYHPDIEHGIVQVNPSKIMNMMGFTTNEMTAQFMMSDVFIELFENTDVNNKMYQVLSGRMPKEYNEVVLLVDENNEINDYVLYALGIKDQKELLEFYEKIQKGEEIKSEPMSFTYDELLDLSFKVLFNTDYYSKVKGVWVDKREDTAYLKKKLKNSMEIHVVGIVKPNEEWTGAMTTTGGVLYTDALEKYVIDKVNNSTIVKEQKANPKVNVLTGMKFQGQLDTYENVLLHLGSVDLEKPKAIHLYAKDFDSKEEIKTIINDYNKLQEEQGKEGDTISYTDFVGLLMSSVTDIINIISYVLIGFVSISLVVSSIMIGIITYISVLERTKEIGILRAIGASKKDVSRVFNAETLIVGFVAGFLGIGVTLLLNLPINALIYQIANVQGISQLPWLGALILILISVLLTTIAGLIPSRIASKKDPVESLRSE